MLTRLPQLILASLLALPCPGQPTVFDIIRQTEPPCPAVTEIPQPNEQPNWVERAAESSPFAAEFVVQDSWNAPSQPTAKTPPPVYAPDLTPAELEAALALYFTDQRPQNQQERADDRRYVKLGARTLRFEQNGRFGVMDTLGKILIRPKFEQLQSANQPGLFIGYGKRFANLYDLQGKEKLPRNRYVGLTAIPEGYLITQTIKGYGLTDRNGKELLPRPVLHYLSGTGHQTAIGKGTGWRRTQLLFLS